MVTAVVTAAVTAYFLICTNFIETYKCRTSYSWRTHYLSIALSFGAVSVGDQSTNYCYRRHASTYQGIIREVRSHSSHNQDGQLNYKKKKNWKKNLGHALIA